MGTVDQKVIDQCIMEEVKQYHRNLVFRFYDYKEAYDKVHHELDAESIQMDRDSRRGDQTDLEPNGVVEG